MSVHETATEPPATEPPAATTPPAAAERAVVQPAATEPAAAQPAAAQPAVVQPNGAPHGYASHAYAPEIVFDAFDPEHWPNPYPRYAVARAARPLFPTPLGVHLVTRYQDCAAVLQDDTWSHAHEAQLFHPGVDTTDLPASFLWMDPPDHTRLRGLVSKAFTPRTVTALRPRIERLVRELFDAIVKGDDAGEADVITALAYPLPLTVIAELIGAPAADHPDLQRWSRALARGFDPDPLLTPEEREGRSQAAREFVAYFRGLIAWRRAEPADDLISELAAVEERGDVLTEDEVLATCVTLLVAGHETSVNLVANGLLALIRHPDQYALLRSSPELVAPAVEEMLRYDSPVHLTTRLAHRRTELAGRTFEAGDGVVLLFGSANRDPAAFAEPERFDLTRYASQPPARRHLTFSLGIHYCLGAPLARLEMELVLRELLRRGLTMTLLTDRLDYRRNLVLRGLASLPVRFEQPGVPAQRLAGRGSGQRAGLDPS
ncbi:cytochrome P450 [Frankia sp. AgB1.9]|uniref:cytochrome P450 n=1 Tax=unclassified Frankia TaxID=2632575 RepID=UPI001932AA94|nr:MULTISPECIES: cytochrome P450 [unclassified Frankia]MBL7493604.1 cytochrome P450 [Frankia sp. AgW1.1]MBL7551379.1 cytochrome P450 [Frankia sp. AgB1.9]MBL7618954.1 cytochrome P450 [Frankia sp. AgB1.8]